MNIKNPFHRNEALARLKNDTDRYRELGFIGKGRSTDVSSIFDSRLNRIIAGKRLRKENLSNDELVKSFINETKLISYLDHPGVVSIYDVFLQPNGEPCYTMKLLKGNILSWDLKSKTKGQFLSIFTKLCETLAYVHDKGVIHLDLNPDNIILGNYGEVLITDWGNARLYDTKPYYDYLKLVKDAPLPPIDDDTHPSLGTPQYMSPEQTLQGRESLTPSSDIFSMGIILYLTMSGRLPFVADNKEELFMHICNVNPPMLHEISPDIPWRLSQICAKMIDKDPFLRYHSFHEVLMDIDRFRNSGEAFQTAKYNAGDIIFNEGDPGDFAFIILSGKVEVFRLIDGQQKKIAEFGPNEIVGELAILTPEKRTGTVRAAANDTLIRILARPAVEHELQKLSPWVSHMITAVSQRFIELSRIAHK